MIQERRNKFIAFVIGFVATVAILFATVERRHQHWHDHCHSSACMQQQLKTNE